MIKKITANKPRKIRMCLLLEPKVVRRFKLQAMRAGCRGISDYFIRMTRQAWP